MAKKKPDLPAKQVEEVEDCQEAVSNPPFGVARRGPAGPRKITKIALDPAREGVSRAANGPNVPTGHGDRKPGPSANGLARAGVRSASVRFTT